MRVLPELTVHLCLGKLEGKKGVESLSSQGRELRFLLPEKPWVVSLGVVALPPPQPFR